MPFAELAGWDVAVANLTELAVHAWDLSRATGQHYRIEEKMVEAVFDLVQQASMDVYRAQPGEFEAACECAADARIADRLAALLGRQP